MKNDNKNSWIYIRNNEVCAVFKNRQEAVIYLKELLKQTLKDFDKQDKTNEFDYEFEIPAQQFKLVKHRESFLSLI